MLSRIQLAAALIEYDNDDDLVANIPSQPPRNWRDSAIFTPFIQTQQEERRRKILAQPPPVLPGVSCQETGTSNNNEKHPAPRSYKGITEDPEENIADNVDIDVGDWGLPSHLVSEPVRPRQRAISQPLSMLSAQRASKPLALKDDNSPSGLRDNSGRRASLDQYRTRQAWAEPQNLDLALGRHTAMGLQDGTTPLPNSSSPIATLRPITARQELDTFKERNIPNDSEPNPFALPALGRQTGSRFDPEERHRSSLNSANGLAMGSKLPNGFTLSSTNVPRRWSASSKIENSLTEPMPDYSEIPTAKQFGRPLMPPRYSTSAVTQISRRSLRPNVLVMPSPLADSESLHPDVKVPDGFVRGDKPLPAEAKTKGRRPGLPLSLSQKTFRSSLLVDGKREDEEYFVGSSEIEGEIGVSSKDITIDAIQRRSGKLYGKSLIDELEARKAMMKGKRRVFTGDFRPAMMSRSTMFFEPSSLAPPSSDLIVDPSHSTKSRPSTFHSSKDRPLIQSDTIDGGQHMSPSDSNHRDAKGRSVFGVDHVWESEMTKLKSRLDEGAMSGEGETRRVSKDLRKEDKEDDEHGAIGTTVDLREDKAHIEDNSLARHQLIPPIASGQEPEEDQSLLQDQSPSPLSDRYSDEDVPLSKIARRSTPSKESSSAGNKTEFTPSISPPLTDSEEEVPLSQLALKYSSAPSTKGDAASEITAPSRLQPSPSADGYDEDEDDLPLAVRQAQAKGLTPPSRAEIIEDELPLGFKHVEAVQRRMAQSHMVGGMWGDIQNDVNRVGTGIGAPNPYMMWGVPGHMPLGLPQPLLNSSTPSMPNLNVLEGNGVFSSPASNIDNWRQEVRPPSERARTGDDGRDQQVIRHMIS